MYIVLCNVFTPTRNAIDLSVHRNDKEHTNTRMKRLMALMLLRWWNTSIKGMRMNDAITITVK